MSAKSFEYHVQLKSRFYTHQNQLLSVIFTSASHYLFQFNIANKGRECICNTILFPKRDSQEGGNEVTLAVEGPGCLCVCVCVRACVCVCENLNLPVNEYVAHVSQIPIVSRKISERDRNMQGRVRW